MCVQTIATWYWHVACQHQAGSRVTCHYNNHVWPVPGPTGDWLSQYCHTGHCDHRGGNIHHQSHHHQGCDDTILMFGICGAWTLSDLCNQRQRVDNTVNQEAKIQNRNRFLFQSSHWNARILHKSYRIKDTTPLGMPSKKSSYGGKLAIKGGGGPTKSLLNFQKK